MPEVNREYKDRLFKFIFGNPEHKAWTLSLYNALSGSDYDDPDDIQFTTIDDVVYISMKNDISFLIADEMNFYEQQSTYNPNMPMRFFLYAGMVYAKYTETSDSYSRYSSRLQFAPAPRCVCFYDGAADAPEKEILSLSDAFIGSSDIEVKVTMLNINYGKNKALLEACQPLGEYSWFVDTVRIHYRETNNIDAAVDTTLSEMRDGMLIKSFILKNKAEVKSMYLTEYDEARAFAEQRRDGWEDGRAQGIKEGMRDGLKTGISETNERVASDMLKSNLPLGLIEKISRLPETAIRDIAAKLGVAVIEK